MLLPGATIGILGSGQLGRMLALEARRMGYSVHVFSPEADSPTGQIAAREVVADYANLDAVRDFAKRVGVVTFEFENVPAATAAAAAEHAPVHPSGAVLHTTQHRQREKDFLSKAGLPVTRYAPVDSLPALEAVLAQLGVPAVLKTAGFGYDGKGQARVDQPSEAAAAWQAIGAQPAIVEGRVPFEREVSVVAARGQDGAFAHFGVIENTHAHHILDVSIAPAPVPAAVAREAVEMARVILEKLDVVGVLCVEFFVLPGGKLLVNELAPRPHNSGHLTIDACATSQFEQQLRAVCGLPLGATDYRSPAAMVQLLGDLWSGDSLDGEPDWAAALARPGVKLHLYGKHPPRPGRKMGHLTALGATADEACALALTARAALTKSHA